VIELPPIAEQQEIVRRVDALFKIADEIDRLFAKARSRVEGLVPSTLTKAFRGDLVAPEANLAESEGRPFESAQELPARVQPDLNFEIEPRRNTHPGGRGSRNREPMIHSLLKSVEITSTKSSTLVLREPWQSPASD
jgi:hypothetical protein